jgi:hypothetical protein
LTAECLRRCLESGSPLATLAVYVNELRQRHYDEGDIGLVDRRARRVLWALLDHQEAWPREASWVRRPAGDRQSAKVSRV